jgi:hypothetical protein
MIAVVTGRADRAKPITWIEIGSVAGPTASIPSATLRAIRLQLVGSGQGSVSTRGYSLLARSSDEEVTAAVRELACSAGDPDSGPAVAIVVLDATTLARSLYLLTQVARLGVPLVVALTMLDLAAVETDSPTSAAQPDALAASLGSCIEVPVAPMNARSRADGGRSNLARAVDDVAVRPWRVHRYHRAHRRSRAPRCGRGGRPLLRCGMTEWTGPTRGLRRFRHLLALTATPTSQTLPASPSCATPGNSRLPRMGFVHDPCGHLRSGGWRNLILRGGRRTRVGLFGGLLMYVRAAAVRSGALRAVHRDARC